MNWYFGEFSCFFWLVEFFGLNLVFVIRVRDFIRSRRLGFGEVGWWGLGYFIILDCEIIFYLLGALEGFFGRVVELFV